MAKFFAPKWPGTLAVRIRDSVVKRHADASHFLIRGFSIDHARHDRNEDNGGPQATDPRSHTSYNSKDTSLLRGERGNSIRQHCR